MAIGLDEVWRHRRASTRFRSLCAFEGDAIVLGAGTKLLDLARMVGAPRAESWARMAALLKAAGHAPPNEATRLHVQTALLDWWHGDRAVAQLRLALLPLPTLRRVEDAYPLFLAEHLLDQGMAPNELLRALKTQEPDVTKYDASQPRLPRGVTGGGQWTRGTGSASTSVAGKRPEGESSAATPRSGSPSGLIQPIFFDAEQHPEVEVTPFLPHKPSLEGDLPHAELPHTPSLPSGAPAFAPAPRLAPAEAPAGPKSGGSFGLDDTLEPPACRPKDDVGHGASADAMTYEHQMAELLNPGNPTFKRLPGDPAKPASEAYFLWSPEAGKELSFDDCKKDNRPSTLIPGIRQGDGVEYKSDTYWTADKDWTDGYDDLEATYRRFNEMLLTEGRGRQIYVCFGRSSQANAANRRFSEKYLQVHSVFCPRPEAF